MNTYSRLSKAQVGQSKSLEKLSSGLRINKAGDDAAGLAISEKMRGQIGGLNQAAKNAQDGISLIQTAEGGLNETHSILNRMRELSVQSANDTNTDDDRVEIQKEMNQLSQEISRISSDTEFNGKQLLAGEDGASGFKGKFHIGANKGQATTLEINNMSSKSLGVEGTVTKGTVGGLEVMSHDSTATVTVTVGVADTATTTAVKDDDGNYTVTTKAGSTGGDGDGEATMAEIKAALEDAGATVKYASGEDGTSVQADDIGAVTLSTVATEESKEFGIDVSTQEAANAAIETIDGAIGKVSAERSKLGAVQNRLDHTINNLTTTSENLSAAESRIRDVDMAKEMMEFTKNNILNQAATSMLAQANQMPQSVLQLL